MTRRGWALFAAMGLIWGLPYLLIRVAVRDLSPATLVFARTAPAALLLLPLAIRRHSLRPLLQRWRTVLVFTLVEVTLPWLLLASAERRLSSSVSGLLVAVVPLIGAAIATATGSQHRLPPAAIIGLLIGLAGVGFVVGIKPSGISALGVVEVLGTAVGYAVGPMVVNRYLADVPSIGVIASSFALTAIIYAPFALTHLPQHLTIEVVGAISALAIVCTTLAFLLFFALIAEIGPVRATVITYVNPAVAVTLGVLLLREPFTLGMAVGFPLILAGSLLTTRVPAAKIGPFESAASTEEGGRPELGRFS